MSLPVPGLGCKLSLYNSTVLLSLNIQARVFEEFGQMLVLCSPGNQFMSDTCLLLGPLTAMIVSRRDAERMGRLVMYLVVSWEPDCVSPPASPCHCLGSQNKSNLWFTSSASTWLHSMTSSKDAIAWGQLNNLKPSL